MPRTGLTLALLLLPPLALAGAPAAAPLAVEFDAPAQAGPGVAALDATWLLLVFGDEGSGSVSLRFGQPAQERNFTTASALGNGATEDAEAAQARSDRALPPFEGEARFDGLASIYLEGERIRLDAAGAQASLVRPTAECLWPLLPQQVVHDREARYAALCPPGGGPAVVMAPDAGNASLPVRIEADGLRVVELHHAAVACADGSSCPGGGRRDGFATGPPSLGLTGRVLGYSRIGSSGATASGSGRVAHVLAGAPSLDLAVDGWVRLPLADGGPVARQTLRAEGNVTLADLRLTPGGRMAATLGGDVRHARLDEGGVDPAVLFGVGAAGVAATAAAAFAWALFSRIPASRSLDHPRRRLILEAIRANPGIHLRDLARLAGGSPTLAQYHVGVLVRNGHAVARRQGRRLCLFENHGRYGDEWHALAALRDEALLRLHRHVAACPGAARPDVVRAAESWGWSRRTAYHRLGRLERLGLIQEGGPAGAGLRALHPPAARPGAA